MNFVLFFNKLNCKIIIILYVVVLSSFCRHTFYTIDDIFLNSFNTIVTFINKYLIILTPIKITCVICFTEHGQTKLNIKYFLGLCENTLLNKKAPLQ